MVVAVVVAAAVDGPVVEAVWDGYAYLSYQDSSDCAWLGSHDPAGQIFP